MALDDADIAAITLLLSPDRLAALTALTGSPRAAIELHQETLGLSAELMNVVASVELALRNSVCENLATHFATPAWLTNPPVHFRWKDVERDGVTRAVKSAKRAKYAKMTQAEKADLDVLAFPHGRPPNMSHLKRGQLRMAQIPVPSGSVVAELTLHFWKKLYGGDYDQTLWRTTLKRTFPHKRTKRPLVAEKLEAIYQTRNRLAHHEPVLHRRFDNAVTAITWVSENLGTATPGPDTPLAKLIAGEFQIMKDRAAALHARLDAYRV